MIHFLQVSSSINAMQKLGELLVLQDSKHIKVSTSAKHLKPSTKLPSNPSKIQFASIVKLFNTFPLIDEFKFSHKFLRQLAKNA
jgi:hypothetical protein